MKKMLFGAFLGMFAVAGVAILPNYASADTTTQTQKQGQQRQGEGYTQFGADLSKGGFGDQDLGYSPEVYGKETFQKDNLIKTIQNTINWVLGILALIALCLCLWGGFQMMVSGGDSKKYEAGINLLKWAAIGLAVIAVSWLVVSLIFYLINTNVESTEGTATKLS